MYFPQCIFQWMLLAVIAGFQFVGCICSVYSQEVTYGGYYPLLWARSDVETELEIVDHQKQELAAIQLERKKLKEEEDRAGKEPNSEEGINWRRELAKRRSAVLLPHQRNRLRQLSVQCRILELDERDERWTAGLLWREIGGVIGIDEKQGHKIGGILVESRAEIEAAEAKARESLFKIRASAIKECLQVLDAQQRAAYEQRYGEPFAF